VIRWLVVVAACSAPPPAPPPPAPASEPIDAAVATQPRSVLPDHPGVSLALLRLSAPWVPGRFDLRRFWIARRITYQLRDLARSDPSTSFAERRDLLDNDILADCDPPTPSCAVERVEGVEYVMFGSVVRDPIGFAVTIELVRMADHSVRAFTARTGDDETSFANLATDGYRYLLHRI
jgi:hypothetical protein